MSVNEIVNSSKGRLVDRRLVVEVKVVGENGALAQRDQPKGHEVQGTSEDSKGGRSKGQPSQAIAHPEDIRG